MYARAHGTGTTVKWFNHKNGYGFIEREGDSDLFVHITNIEGKIVDGDSVEFDVSLVKVTRQWQPMFARYCPQTREEE